MDMNDKPDGKSSKYIGEYTGTDSQSTNFVPPPSSALAEDSLDESDLQEGREARQIRFLQTVAKETNFVFMFGAAQRGKTVITSSIINFLSSVDARGELSPFRLKRDSNEDGDPGRRLFNNIRRVFAQQRFPERTVLVGEREPIYVNVRFTPHKELDANPLSLSFLEMPGEDLQTVDAPDGGDGQLPPTIKAFMRVKGLTPAFILVTEPEKAFDDDQLMASFIDYINDIDRRFSNSKFLLLVTKWDEYEGNLSVAEFVKEKMRLTHAKLFDPKHSISAFSIGEVDKVDKKPFLKSFDPTYAKQVTNWLYQEFNGQPLYRRSKWHKFLDFIKRFL